MMTGRCHYEIVQVFKIIGIVRQQHTSVANGMSELDGIVFAQKANVGGRLHIVARPLEQRNQERASAVFVKVDSHRAEFGLSPAGSAAWDRDSQGNARRLGQWLS